MRLRRSFLFRGSEKLRIGGHDPIGEAYVDFQRCLKQLSRRGILLAIVSKNEEATALESIQKHPEMVLKLEDFAGWRLHRMRGLEDRPQRVHRG
jgi:predicted enzyme involved in methoxymalonyl-ACP biosynthesis